MIARPELRDAAHWIRRGGAALVGLAVDAAIDSLQIGRRCWSWLSSPRHLAVTVVALALAAGVAGAVLRMQRPKTASAAGAPDVGCPHGPAELSHPRHPHRRARARALEPSRRLGQPGRADPRRRW
jgi:hypothetical protein